MISNFQLDMCPMAGPPFSRPAVQQQLRSTAGSLPRGAARVHRECSFSGRAPFSFKSFRASGNELSLCGEPAAHPRRLGGYSFGFSCLRGGVRFGHSTDRLRAELFRIRELLGRAGRCIRCAREIQQKETAFALNLGRGANAARTISVEQTFTI
jgi:hypothetical protein